MVYFRVYAPDGEPFDVIRDIADNLLLNLGWTQTPTFFDAGASPAVSSNPDSEAE